MSLSSCPQEATYASHFPVAEATTRGLHLIEIGLIRTWTAALCSHKHVSSHCTPIKPHVLSLCFKISTPDTCTADKKVSA